MCSDNQIVTDSLNNPLHSFGVNRMKTFINTDSCTLDKEAVAEITNLSSGGRYYLLSSHTVLTSPSLEISFINIHISLVTLFHTAIVPPAACLQQTNKTVCSSSSHCHSATLEHIAMQNNLQWVTPANTIYTAHNM